MLLWALWRQRDLPPQPFFQPIWRRKVSAGQPRPRPEQAAYAADPGRLATCHHLQPIEMAMRQAQIPVRLLYGTVVDATCVIDERRLKLENPVVYYGNVPGDRPGEPPSAHLNCPEHGSSICVVHPDSARPGTPMFPA